MPPFARTPRPTLTPSEPPVGEGRPPPMPRGMDGGGVAREVRRSADPAAASWGRPPSDAPAEAAETTPSGGHLKCTRGRSSSLAGSLTSSAAPAPSVPRLLAPPRRGPPSVPESMLDAEPEAEAEAAAAVRLGSQKRRRASGRRRVREVTFVNGFAIRGGE